MNKSTTDKTIEILIERIEELESKEKQYINLFEGIKKIIESNSFNTHVEISFYNILKEVKQL